MITLYSITILWITSTIGWLISIVLSNAGVVDILWGISISFLAAYNFYHQDIRSVRLWIVTSCILLWGIRLSAHLFYRNHILFKREDVRYTKIKDKHQKNWIWYSYINPFLMALIGELIVALPVFGLNCKRYILNSPKFLSTSADWIGIIFFGLGIYFEVIADWELLNFMMIKKNRGRLLTDGLWRYTRHPNYFGECLIWFGIYAFACSQGAYWTILSPLYVFCIIYFYSGVEWKEKHMLNTREIEYDRYKRQTAKFVPFLKY